MKTVDETPVLVILGAVGYMGMTCVKAIQNLNRKRGPISIDGEHLILVDIDFNKKELDRKSAWNEVESILGFSPRAVADFSSIHAYIWGVRIGNPKRPIIIYDATPSNFHGLHLGQIAEFRDSNIVYLGEKPLFTDASDLENAGQYPSECRFLCDLIETESPVFLNVKDYLRRHNLSVDQIWLWRAGASAIKKAVGDDRPGIMGGALEDKSLHDFAITLGWLGGPSAGVKVLENSIQVTEEGSFCLSDNAMPSKATTLLSMNNTPIDSFKELKSAQPHRTHIPADAFTAVDCSWSLGGRTIEGHYIFSWRGISDTPVERRFGELWTSHANLELPRGSHKVTKGGFEYDVEERRVAIVQCHDGSREQWILCNFLAKDVYPGLRRFAYAFDTHGKRIKAIYEDQSRLQRSTHRREHALKTESLADILETVIQHANGKGTACSIEKMSCLILHRAMFDAQANRRLKILSHFERECDGEKWWKDHCKKALIEIRKRVREI